MEPKNKNPNDSSPQQGHHEHPLRHEINARQKSLNDLAHEEAEKDFATDADSIHSPNDDLDEGELSRLGEDVPV
jgi:hypothetical protein